MIPRAHVTAWRKHAPWASDSLVEQDLVLCRAIVELFADELVAGHLAFRGGTALHKMFFDSLARFSEDIDLVQRDAGPIGPVMGRIHERLDGWLGKPTTKQGAGRVTMLYRYASDIEPAGRRRLKIEINTREHFTVLGLERLPFRVSNPWFEGEALVTVYALEELLGTKLRALYQRKKGRDLFDLSLALAVASIDAERVVRCFTAYMDHAGTPTTRAQFEASLAAKAHDRAFLEDVERLLAPGTAWHAEAGLREVTARLVARLPGEPWKGGARS